MIDQLGVYFDLIYGNNSEIDYLTEPGYLNWYPVTEGGGAWLFRSYAKQHERQPEYRRLDEEQARACQERRDARHQGNEESFRWNCSGE